MLRLALAATTRRAACFVARPVPGVERPPDVTTSPLGICSGCAAPPARVRHISHSAYSSLSLHSSSYPLQRYAGAQLVHCTFDVEINVSVAEYGSPRLTKNHKQRFAFVYFQLFLFFPFLCADLPTNINTHTQYFRGTFNHFFCKEFVGTKRLCFSLPECCSVRASFPLSFLTGTYPQVSFRSFHPACLCFFFFSPSVPPPNLSSRLCCSSA